jgi:hypothetical protein
MCREAFEKSLCCCFKNFWVVKWTEFLATDPEVGVRFAALPDFLRRSGSGMGFTQPREYNLGATWKKKQRSRKSRLRPEGCHANHVAPSISKNWHQLRQQTAVAWPV